jgi:hypothetical protein
MHDEGEILHVFGQTDIEIYIIGSPLEYRSSPITIRWLWTKLQPGEFPQIRNYKRTTKLRSRSVMVKVTLKYTLVRDL